MSIKHISAAVAVLFTLSLPAQTCFSITNRTNGNGNPGTCGTPVCSGNAKTGHIDVNFPAGCPGIIPSLQLISVSSGSLPTPFCFDPGNCISPGTVRYCFRGTNLPSSGFMTLRLTQGALTWNCTYDVNGGNGTLLPVKLAGFEAKLQQQKVWLQWRTEQELNNEEFQIEKSTDNRDFVMVGKVDGRGTTTTAQQYSFVDENPAKGISFYRLKQIDINGAAYYSLVVRVDNRVPGIQIRQLYPNPASANVNLRLITDEPTGVNARIFNVAGMQVLGVYKKLARGEQEWHIGLPQLAAGIYKLVIADDKGGILSERLMVN